ncbi:MAG: peptidoglycan-binding protein, partial [Eubacteriales bacterium]
MFLLFKPKLIILCTLVSALVISGITYAALGDNNLSNGMRGSEVTELQQRLSMLGYEVGSTDGIFGPKTDSGVRLFQKEHGLTVDGIAGPNTINELKKLTGESLTSGGTSIGYKNTDVNLLARLVSAEARGEPYRGQIAVAAVVMNRIKSSSFPNNARDVIYQPSAFTRVNDGQINLSPT